MSLMLPFDRFLYGNNIYQVNNILESALPTKHRSVIFVRYIYKIIIIKLCYLALSDFPVRLFGALLSVGHLSLFGGSGLTSEAETMNDNGMMTADPYPARLTGIISYESSECLAISGYYSPTL